jgi:outer membrane protein assembly factor BamB
VPGDTLVPPVVPIWTRRLEGRVGPPLVADGAVFVSVGSMNTGSAATLHALDAATGRPIWDVRLGESPSLAYDHGLLVASAFDTTWGLEAGTGHTRWTAGSVGPDPAVTGGAVYGSNIALDAQTGQVIWQHSDPGSNGAPAVDAANVYVAATCGYVFGIDRVTGATRWHHDGGCASGGGGGKATLADGRVLAYDITGGFSIYNAADGSPVGFVASSGPPIANDGRAVALAIDSGTGRVSLLSVRTADRRQAWRRTLEKGPIPGYAHVVGAGRWVYDLLENSVLEMRSAANGGRVYATRIPRYAPFGDDYGGEYSGEMSAGPGLLVTVQGRQITGYASLFNPPAGRVDALPVGPVAYGDRVRVMGRTGPGLAGSSVRFVAARRVVGTSRSQPDGYVGARLRIDRNRTVRAIAGSARSRPFRVFVYPRQHLSVHRVSNTRVLIGIGFQGPRGVRLAGRMSHLYVARASQHRYVRLGSARVLARGPGRSLARFVIRPISPLGPDDYLFACVVGQAQAGLGDPQDRFLRRCGAHLIHF